MATGTVCGVWPVKLVDERHAAWESDLPLGDDAALWDYLTVLDQGTQGQRLVA